MPPIDRDFDDLMAFNSFLGVGIEDICFASRGTIGVD